MNYESCVAGNRTQTVINSVTNEYTLGVGNRLAGWGASGSVSYDSAGNTTNIVYNDARELDLQWDERYRLTEAAVSTVSATSTVSYAYDVLGRRISRSETSGASTNTEHYVYDGAHVVADLDAGGQVLRSYTWGPGVDNLLSMTVHGPTETNSYYALKDHLGSVLALADENGNIAESYEYDAWGNVLKIRDGSGNVLSKSAVGNCYMWQGREYDHTTGLYYFRARWYDPVTGRWLSKDPIGIAGGLNQYVAFANNPVMFVDPLGLRDYTEWQTTMILRDAVRDYKLSSWGAALLDARKNHGSGGKYDYALGSDTFVVNGRTLSSDQFGNYIAGYATYGRFGRFGELLTRAAGHWYELLKLDNPYWLDDPGSREMIDMGIHDFYNDYRHWKDMLYPDDVWQNIYDRTMSESDC